METKIMNIWHDCPRCGSKGAASGESFCGKCEEDYQKSQEEYEAMLREEHEKRLRLISDD